MHTIALAVTVLVLNRYFSGVGQGLFFFRSHGKQPGSTTETSAVQGFSATDSGRLGATRSKPPTQVH